MVSTLTATLVVLAARTGIPEPTRTIALMALLGIVLLGLLLVAGTLLGGSWVRKVGSFQRGRAVPEDLILRNPSKKSSIAEYVQSSEPCTTDTKTSEDTIESNENGSQ